MSKLAPVTKGRSVSILEDGVLAQPTNFHAVGMTSSGRRSIDRACQDPSAPFIEDAERLTFLWSASVRGIKESSSMPSLDKRRHEQISERLRRTHSSSSLANTPIHCTREASKVSR